MKQESKQLSAMLIPVSWGYLLLPCSVIAELVDFQEPETIQDSPDWFLGNVNWRQQTIPVVSFELMTGQPLKKFSEETRLIVMNRITENGQNLFYAMPVQGIPRNFRIAADDVGEKSRCGNRHRAHAGIEQFAVSISGIDAVIPDLVTMESLITEVSQPCLV